MIAVSVFDLKRENKIMSVAPALRIELRPDDLESPALTFTLHRNIYILAGPGGVEPPFTESKSVILTIRLRAYKILGAFMALNYTIKQVELLFAPIWYPVTDLNRRRLACKASLLTS